MYAMSEDEPKKVIGHIFWNFVAVLVLFGAAIGCSTVEQWCEQCKLPDYLCFGIKTVSIVIFILDGILLCSTIAIVTYELIAELIRRLRK